jgi:hypothetical protein
MVAGASGAAISVCVDAGSDPLSVTGEEASGAGAPDSGVAGDAAGAGAAVPEGEVEGEAEVASATGAALGALLPPPPPHPARASKAALQKISAKPVHRSCFKGAPQVHEGPAF